MLSSFVTAFALAASVSNVAAGPIRHATRGYAQDAAILEGYTGYHVRYLALQCQDQHNTPFFEDCCHPLLRWQKLSDRPAKCTPSASASSSAVVVEPTSPPIDEDPIPDYDDDCDDDTTSASAPAPSTTPAPTAPAQSTEHTTTKTKTQTTSYKPEPTPEPSTTQKPSSSPQPSPTKKTSSSAPEPTQGSGGSGDIKGGSATFYSQDGVAGACGNFHGDYDKIVALDYRRYGDINAQSPDCGRTVVITNNNNGKTVTAKVADACPTCDNENCLDLSKGAFQEIATFEEGQVPITWHFVN